VSILKKYQLLDKAINKNHEDKIEKIFQDILKDVINIINQKFEKNEFLDVNNDIEKAVIRAMFEHMLELWDEEEREEAKTIGYDMLYLVKDEKLKEMFSMFVVGILEGLSVDKFFEKYVNEAQTYKDYFFIDFKKEIDALIIKHKKQFQEEYAKDAK